MRRVAALIGGPALAVVMLAGCAAPAGQSGESAGPAAGGASASVLSIEGAFRPELSWPDLGGTRYVVGIVSESGASWAWEGEERSVIVGGVPEIDWVGPGFAIEGPAQLTFAAFDADGALLHLERTAVGG